MTVNEGGWDRMVRVIAGAGLLSLTVVGPHSRWGLIGLVPLLTGIVGFCPLYRVFGFSTCPAKPAGSGPTFRILAVIAAVISMGAVLGAQGGGMRGRMGGMAMDAGAPADMQVFHQLVDQRDKITRTVTAKPDGVDSVTESDDPAVAKLLQTHVEAMAARVKEARPIHQRDPLFAEVFKHADKIAMTIAPTPKGVRVVETSADAYTVRLIQAHADVISLFLKNGYEELMKNHPVPERSK